MIKKCIINYFDNYKKSQYYDSFCQKPRILFYMCKMYYLFYVWIIKSWEIEIYKSIF